MLLSHVIFLVDIALQRCENAPLFEKVFATIALETQHAFVGNSMCIRGSINPLWGNRKVLQLFPQDDDGLLREERILVRSKVGGGEGIDKVLLCGIKAWRCFCPIKGIGCCTEKL